MKKLFYGAAALALFIGFTLMIVSCGSSSSPSAPSATATPTASVPTATPTPASTPVVFIYGTSTVVAGNFQTLLNANGYNVTTTTIAGASGLTMSNYAVIIISDDSYTTGPSWGNGALVSAITASGKPVLGLCLGGTKFFDTAGSTAIGYGNSSGNTGTAITAQATSNSLWTTPNSISTSGTQTLYSISSRDYEEYYASAPPTGTVLYGLDPSNANDYPLASYTASGLTYFLWGFQGDPSTMTTEGKNLFINVMNSL